MSTELDFDNPGQFFACCGLLELAGRLWPGSQGCFGSDRGLEFFMLEAPGHEYFPYRPLFDALCTGEPPFVLAPDHDRYPPDRKPFILKRPFDLRLDWWLTDDGSDLSPLKTWDELTSPIGMLLTLASKLRELNVDDDVWNGDIGIANNPGMLMNRLETSGLGLDPDAARVFFGSPAFQHASPLTEFFAMIGLQSCRPVSERAAHGNRFVYRPWTEPVAADGMPAAVAGGRPSLGAFAFRIDTRADGGRYFGRAERVQNA
jgi:hypothetical protein